MSIGSPTSRKSESFGGEYVVVISVVDDGSTGGYEQSAIGQVSKYVVCWTPSEKNIKKSILY